MNVNLKNEVESQTHELITLKKEHLDYLQRLKLITSQQASRLALGGSGVLSGSDILSEIEQLMDELRVRRDEALSYKQQMAL